MIDIIGIGSAGVESLSIRSAYSNRQGRYSRWYQRHLELFPEFKGALVELGPLKAALKRIKAAGSTCSRARHRRPRALRYRRVSYKRAWPEGVSGLPQM